METSCYRGLKITRCSDSLMWYRDFVGKIFDFVGEDEDIYWTREPEGYKNIVLKTDAEIINE
jgi:hypothetical protein